MFPAHGRISCSLCFPSPGKTVSTRSWQFRNDPTHFGSANPKVLVLGFSKGPTQVKAYDNGPFEEVAFAGSRERLKKILLTLGLLHEDENIDLKFREEEEEFAFASLIRCSVARIDEKTLKVVAGSPMILKAFQEPEPKRLITNCAKQFLVLLPERLRLIVMLGVQDGYISECRKLMNELHQGQIKSINPVAYANSQVVFVHATHPSRQNGWIDKWISCPAATSPLGQKRELAKEAVSRIPGLFRGMTS